MVYSSYTMRALLLSLAACGTQFGRGVLPQNDGATDVGSGPDTPAVDAPTYQANAVELDTAGNDYLTRGNIGANNSASGTFSVWLRFHAGDGAAQDIVTATVSGYGGGVTRTSTGEIEFVMRDCLGASVLDVQTLNPYTTTNGWFHVLASWDLTAMRADIYIGENGDRAVGGTINNQNICYSAVNWAIGGVNSGVLDADIADLYVDLGTFTDFTDPNNRRLFSTSDGKPVALGPTCATPSGHQPIMCFTSPAATWNKNSGSGGDFTINGDGLTAVPGP